MKIGLSTASFYSLAETEDNAAHTASLPVDTCEVFLETHSEYSADFARIVLNRLNGLHVTSVHPKGTQFEADLFARSERQTMDARHIFEGVLSAGETLGAKYYVMHGPGSIVTPVTPTRIYRLAENMAVLQEMARNHHMEILWENVSWCALRTPDDLQTLKGLLPDIHFVLDVKQAFRAGVAALDMLDAIGENLRHVHVLDYLPDGQLCLPGEGCFDWPALFTKLKHMHYDGSIILEPYVHLAGEDARLARSLDYLRKLAQ